jgi:hypothetical protein
MDQTPPVVRVSSPAPGSSLSGVVPLSVSVDDTSSGVTHVEWRANGATLALETTAPFGATWDTTLFKAGPATITATAVDREGNAASDSVAVTVRDTTSPTLRIAHPSSGATVTGPVDVWANADDAGSAIDHIELSAPPTPILSGENTIVANVSVRYRIAK